jgi:hypothetical protein
MIDRKGVWSFLLLTFGLTFLYEGCLIRSGMTMNFGLNAAGPRPSVLAVVLVALAMWIPALSTVTVTRFVTKEGFGVTNFRFGALKPYIVSALVMPVVFAIILRSNLAVRVGETGLAIAEGILVWAAVGLMVVNLSKGEG